MLPGPPDLDNPALSEPQNANSVAQFLLRLKQINVYIAIQSVLDALDIWLSTIKYVFDSFNPSSANLSTAHMYRWLMTEEGLIIFILGSVFFALFSFAGNYFDAQKQQDEASLVYKFYKFSEYYWPFVRDCFKGLKWTFKGFRSFILVMQLISSQNLIFLITPLGITLGILAALNRGWNRSMVEKRKILQAANDEFREHVRHVNAGFIEVDEQWLQKFPFLSEEFKSLYSGAVLRIKRQDQYDYFYVTGPAQESHGLEYSSHPQTCQLKKLLRTLQSAEEWEEVQLHTDQYLGQTFFYAGQYYYVVQNSQDGSAMVCTEENLAFEYRAQYLSRQEHQFLEQLHYDPLVGKVDYYHYKRQLKTTANLMDQGKLDTIFQIKQSFIHQITNPLELSHQQFYHYLQGPINVTSAYGSALLNGLLNAPYYFLGVLSIVLDVIPSSIFPFAVSICVVFMILNIIAELYQEFDYQRRLYIAQNKAKLSMIKRLVSLEWDKVNEVLDRSLSYTDVDAECIPSDMQGQIALDDAKPAAEVFKQVFLQTLPMIIQSHPDFEQAKQAVVDLYMTPNRDEGMEEQASSMGREVLNYCISQEAQEQLYASVRQLMVYYQDFRYYKNKLKENLVLENTATFMQGIKNGLHIYGVFNGCLIALSTIAFLSGWTFGAVFFYLSVGVGIALVILGVLSTVLLSNRKPAAKLPEAVPPQPLMASQSSGSQVPFWVPEQLPDFILNEQEILPTKNLMISEQCEVFRQFLTGSKKGVKFLQTLLILTRGVSEDIPLSLKLTYAAIGLTYGCLFSLKGLKTLMRVDNRAYEQSVLVGRFFSKSNTTEEERPVLRRSASVFNTAL